MMKLIIVAIAFLLLFTASIPAQVKSEINWVQIDNLLRKENYRGLEFLASTREDIINAFGSDCGDGLCAYDENWSVYFGFIGKDSLKT